MKSVVEMQEEIRALSKRLNELSRELGSLNPDATDDIAKAYERITGLARRYPIKNKKLAAASETAKREYIRILAFLALRNGSNYEQKLLLIQRMVYGMKLNMETGDIVSSGIRNISHLLEESLEHQQLKKHKYSLLLDGLLVSHAAGHASNNELQLIAEIASILQIDRDDLSFLAKLAKSLLEQDQQEFALLPMTDSIKWKGLFNHHIPKEWLEDARAYCGMYTSPTASIGYFAYLSKNKPAFNLLTTTPIGSFVRKDELIVSYEFNGKIKKIKAKEPGYVSYVASRNKKDNNEWETITKVYTVSCFE